MVGNKAQKAVAAALTGVLTLGTVAPALAGTATDRDNWYRLDGTYSNTYVHDDEALSGLFSGTKTIDGKDRYDTMLDTVLYNAKNPGWGLGDNVLGNIVLVSGTSYADALAASSLAGFFNSPIITTPAGELGEQAEKALQFFGQTAGADAKINVWIVGGEAAVSNDVASDVEDLDYADFTVRRVAGEDRQATSIEVMKQIGKLAAFNKLGRNTQYDGWSDTVFVANGTAWADALSVSSFSYSGVDPIVLTNSDGSLTADQLDYLSDQIGDGARVLVVGGPAQVAYDTLNNLVDHEGGLEFIHGDDRYDTSARVINKFADFVYGPVAVATGTNWPDALVGGAFIGQNGGALVLASDDNLDAVDAALENGLGQGVTNYILGGTSAVSEDLEFLLINSFWS